LQNKLVSQFLFSKAIITAYINDEFSVFKVFNEDQKLLSWSSWLIKNINSRLLIVRIIRSEFYSPTKITILTPKSLFRFESVLMRTKNYFHHCLESWLLTNLNFRLPIVIIRSDHGGGKISFPVSHSSLHYVYRLH